MHDLKFLLFFALIFAAIIIGVDTMQMNKEGKPRVLILLGPPGSGKGTQAKRISEKYGVPHISTGDLFRENISKDTELGKRAKHYINQGKLVPDELVLDMLFDRVDKGDCHSGFLLDGFPRTIPQAEALDRYLSAKKTEVLVINLPVADGVIMKRISGRESCKECGHVHNRYFTPSKESGKCDKCRGELFQREDDKLEVVKERLDVYQRQTAPLVTYYKGKGVLQTVNGDRDPEEVFLEIVSAIAALSR